MNYINGYQEAYKIIEKYPEIKDIIDKKIRNNN